MFVSLFTPHHNFGCRSTTLIVSDNLSHIINRIMQHNSKDARRYTDTHLLTQTVKHKKWICLALIGIAAVVTAPLLWSG